MKYIIPLLLAVFTLTACESDSNQTEDQNHQTEVTTSFFEINWILIELNGEPVPETETVESIPTIQFDESENRLYGRGGCNQYNGGFEYDSETGEVEFTQIAATKMACPDMKIENLYFEMLGDVNRMEQSSQLLNFFNDSGETIALFEVMEN